LISLRTRHLALVGLTAFAAQMVVLSQRNVLILEWRPTDLAAIALNYYRNGFHFLHPQILWGGAGAGYVEMECPLLPYTVALLYSVFGVHNWVALVPPIACGVALPLVMLRFTEYVFNPTAGLVAGLFAATAPTWLAMSTGLWPDAPPVLCVALGLYLLTRWSDDHSIGRFVLAGACVALALLLKLTSFYVGLPILFLFWRTYGNRWWRVWQTWAFAAMALVPSALWYIHGYRLFLESQNTFGILASGYSKFATADLLTSPRFYIRTCARVVLFHLTPLGFALALAGAMNRADRISQYVFHVWVGAVLLYFVIAAEGVSLGHYQYALPIVPPAAALAGVGFVVLRRQFESMPALPIPRTAGAMTLACVTLFGVDAAAANYLFQSRGMNFRHLSEQKMRTGTALGRLTPPGALIVVVDADMDDRTPETSMTPPEVFYFSDRRGWYRAMSWLTPSSIEDLRSQGASYLAVSANNARYFRMHYPALYDEYSRRYRRLLDGDDGIIYELTAAPPPAAPPPDAAAR
jgi:4-amino-4-deoxy-L-arabinose transferase-like glycosyltransferase